MVADQLPVTTSLLRRRRRGLAGWAAGVAAVSAIYVAFWPAMGGAEMQALVDSMPEGLVRALGYDQLASAAGYLQSTVFGLLAPALLLVFAIGAGAKLIAGEEEDGTLELELTYPVPRRRVAAERFVVLVTSLVGLVAVTTLVVFVLAAVVDMDVAASGIAAGSAGLLLLVLAYGSVAFGVGAATGRRAIALGVAAGWAVLAFVADAVAPLVEWGAWLEAISPFAWYLGPDPIATGWHLPSLLGLAAVTAVFATLAFVTFDRRDLGV